MGVVEPQVLLEVSLSAVPASCARARDEIGAALQGLAVDMAAVALAVSEAVTNAVVHAYRHCETSHADERVDLRVTADSYGVCISVTDDGVGMSPRDDSPGLGLGLDVIAKLTDQLLIVSAQPGPACTCVSASRRQPTTRDETHRGRGGASLVPG